MRPCTESSAVLLREKARNALVTFPHTGPGGGSSGQKPAEPNTVSHISRKLTWTAVVLLIAAVIAMLVVIKFLEFVANQN